MEDSILSILPPILAIVMVIVTKRVLLSLGTGIVVSALLLGGGNPLTTLDYLWRAAKGIVITDDGLNTWNIYIVVFLFLLGIITTLISMAGGSRAFGQWALTKVKSRTGAQILTVLFGMIIFIDDYFNALAVGQVARPITDRHRVSRAKLAYLIDSTSAPLCVISPISSWGAYIIGIIALVLTQQGLTDMTAFTTFLKIIPYNLYVWTTLAFVFMIVIRKLDFGSMKTHELRAMETGIPYDPNKVIPGQIEENLPVSEKGRVWDLLGPILGLFVGTIATIIITGLQTDSELSLMNIIGNADVALSLVVGGIIGLFIALLLFLLQAKKSTILESGLLGKGVTAGLKSMLPAVLILFFAWGLIALIEELGTGIYLGNVVEQAEINIAYLPVILFVSAAGMAFATGTSWGSFGVLLPIAGQILAVTDISLLIPGLAAVLAGAVMGDHCSPISDTTILSSTGAGCNLMDHVMTQLPYALISGLISAVGYVVIGLTNEIILGYGTLIILLAVFFFILELQKRREELR